MALTEERQDIFERPGRERALPVAANAVIFAGAGLVFNGDGFVEPASEDTGLRSAGRAEESVDNTGGLDGARLVRARTGIFNFRSASGPDEITAEDIGRTVYWVDDETVALTSDSGSRSEAGPVWNVDDDGVWVRLADPFGLAVDGLEIAQDLDVGGDAEVAGALTAAGDAFGMPTVVGPFAAPGAAGAIADAQTNLDMRYVHAIEAIASGWVAPRPGSIVGVSAQISAAIEGVGGTMSVSVVKNGVEVALVAGPFTTVNGAVKATATEDAGVLTFDDGDVLQLSYTSADVSNTPALSGSILVTQ